MVRVLKHPLLHRVLLCIRSVPISSLLFPFNRPSSSFCPFCPLNSHWYFRRCGAMPISPQVYFKQTLFHCWTPAATPRGPHFPIFCHSLTPLYLPLALHFILYFLNGILHFGRPLLLLRRWVCPGKSRRTISDAFLFCLSLLRPGQARHSHNSIV